MVSMSTTPKHLDKADIGGGGREGKQKAAVAEMPAAPVAVPAATEAEEAGWRKVRKPYTITKSRESWTEPEHDKFLEALQLFDRDWKKIESYVGSKTVIQIRSHAQKYFLKVQKNGTGEHLPPPRPKRKAAHPYPQKASKNAPEVQVVFPQQAPPVLMEQGSVMSMDPSTIVRNSNANAAVTPCNNGMGVVAANNCSSSTESPSGTWSASEAIDQENAYLAISVMPDFAQVYSFLGSVFDPNTNGHLHRLREMDPIDIETVLLLMRNLSMNLTSPDFEAHKRLLSSYSSGTDQINSEIPNLLGYTQSLHLPFVV